LIQYLFFLINQHTIHLHDKAKSVSFLSADPLKLCQVEWGVFLDSYFQFSPEIFDRVQVRALAGPLKDIQKLVPKPLIKFYVTWAEYNSEILTSKPLSNNAVKKIPFFKDKSIK
jgi:hypothetical protein